MPTDTHKVPIKSWVRRFKARFLHGPELDRATHELYRWARKERMPTGVRQPSMRTASTVVGEVATTNRRSGRPSDPALPRVLVDGKPRLELVESESLEQALMRELAQELVGAERRRDPRVPFQRLVRFSDGTIFATGEIVNISATGLLIRASVLLPTETVIAGAFRPDETSPGQAVGFRGRVVRHVKDRDGAQMGVEFTRMVQAHRQEVELIIGSQTTKPRRDRTLRGWKASG